MSSTTIRDVVIRVSVESGTSNLGPLASSIQQQLGRALAQQEMLAYVEAVKAKAKVKILRPDAVNAPTSADGSDSDQ